MLQDHPELHERHVRRGQERQDGVQAIRVRGAGADSLPTVARQDNVVLPNVHEGLHYDAQQDVQMCPQVTSGILRQQPRR